MGREEEILAATRARLATLAPKLAPEVYPRFSFPLPGEERFPHWSLDCYVADAAGDSGRVAWRAQLKELLLAKGKAKQSKHKQKSEFSCAYCGVSGAVDPRLVACDASGDAGAGPAEGAEAALDLDLVWSMDPEGQTYELTHIQLACPMCLRVRTMHGLLYAGSDPVAAAQVDATLQHFASTNGLEFSDTASLRVYFEAVASAWYALKVLCGNMPALQCVVRPARVTDGGDVTFPPDWTKVDLRDVVKSRFRGTANATHTAADACE